MNLKPSVAKTLAALSAVGRPRVAGEARLSLFASSSSAGGSDGGAHQGASPNFGSNGAAAADEVVDRLNAERGLHAGTNPGGARFVSAAIPASLDGDELSPAANAARINAENSHLPGFTVPQDRYVRRAGR